MTKKLWLLILVTMLVMVAIIIGAILIWSRQKPNESINDAGNYLNVNEEYVEYNESFGTTCPVGTKFLGAKDAPAIDCKCPKGYEFESNIIGYSTGESCYGAGTECPIMGSVCQPASN